MQSLDVLACIISKVFVVESWDITRWIDRPFVNS